MHAALKKSDQNPVNVLRRPDFFELVRPFVGNGEEDDAWDDEKDADASTASSNDNDAEEVGVSAGAYYEVVFEEESLGFGIDALPDDDDDDDDDDQNDTNSNGNGAGRPRSTLCVVTRLNKPGLRRPRIGDLVASIDGTPLSSSGGASTRCDRFARAVELIQAAGRPVTVGFHSTNSAGGNDAEGLKSSFTSGGVGVMQEQQQGRQKELGGPPPAPPPRLESGMAWFGDVKHCKSAEELEDAIAATASKDLKRRLYSVETDEGADESSAVAADDSGESSRRSGSGFAEDEDTEEEDGKNTRICVCSGECIFVNFRSTLHLFHKLSTF